MLLLLLLGLRGRLILLLGLRAGRAVSAVALRMLLLVLRRRRRRRRTGVLILRRAVLLLLLVLLLVLLGRRLLLIAGILRLLGLGLLAVPALTSWRTVALLRRLLSGRHGLLRLSLPMRRSRWGLLSLRGLLRLLRLNGRIRREVLLLLRWRGRRRGSLILVRRSGGSSSLILLWRGGRCGSLILVIGWALVAVLLLWRLLLLLRVAALSPIRRSRPRRSLPLPALTLWSSKSTSSTLLRLLVLPSIRLSHRVVRHSSFLVERNTQVLRTKRT